MTNLFYNLSDVAIALLFSAIIALVFVVSPLLRERLFGEISNSTSDFVRATMTPITGFTGVVPGVLACAGSRQSPQRRKDRGYRGDATQSGRSAAHQLWSRSRRGAPDGTRLRPVCSQR